MTDSPNSSANNKSQVPLIISAIIIALLIQGYFFIPEMRQGVNEAWNVLTSEDDKKIKQWVNGFGWLGPIVIIVTMVVQTFLLVVPTVALIVVAILAYGPWWGSLLALVAVLTASSVGYVVGKYLGRIFVDKMIGEKTEKKITAFIKDYGFWSVFLVRFNSLLSNDAISFVGGIVKMKFGKFITATAAGISPLIILIALFSQSMEDLKSGLIWVSVLSLAAFGFYLWWDKTR
ncbi:TVP38/TMEM64 family protein [Membranicola marinus]|uniref:TVP38/TMEM64 family membrane protein n=1 Tax=Membranihabitans marinus TaxID=1227546 RepID=A0A953HVT1_9BACT|nr:TVP38/TMEM64 family protein [Membranihabitans marinus]MBY5959076.1 TVP38/TMEM64 family protein [Membranihabitans marinus]